MKREKRKARSKAGTEPGAYDRTAILKESIGQASFEELTETITITLRLAKEGNEIAQGAMQLSMATLEYLHSAGHIPKSDLIKIYMRVSEAVKNSNLPYASEFFEACVEGQIRLATLDPPDRAN